jgi:transcriptional regulator with XRE-family HTH domain
MHISPDKDSAPSSEESLAEYIRRIRGHLALSQKELAEKSGLHLQSLGKIERGKTARLNQKTRRALASALEVPEEYLDKLSGVVTPAIAQTLKICPNCWIPGAEPEAMWNNSRSKFCFACGTGLRSRCAGCGEAIASFRFRFCPHCGRPYKE